MKKITHVVLVLDCSGSMSGVINDTVNGINDVIRTCKNVGSETDLNIHLTLIGFNGSNIGIISDDKYEYDNVPTTKLRPIKYIGANSSTPMYEGILYSIDKLKDAKDVLMAIFTDGQADNAHKLTDVATKISELQKSNWTFVMVAANQDARRVAMNINIPDTNAMDYISTGSGTRSAFYKLSRSLRKYLENKTIPNLKINPVDNFFDPQDELQTIMSVNGLSCTINMPEATKDDDEVTNTLPPYSPVPAYVVDEYPLCPSNWMHGSTKASSYFVAVKPDHGMWLDFNKCCDGNNYDIAVVLSIQGINPITGLKTSELRLEKYDKNCPTHNIPFQQDRFCPECKFKWPAQNYLASSVTPNGFLWLDGFLAPDGKVRQYVFTKQEVRGVAKGIIGDDVVYAIGITFYKSKKPRPVPQISNILRSYIKSIGSNSFRGSRGISGQCVGSSGLLSSNVGGQHTNSNMKYSAGVNSTNANPDPDSPISDYSDGPIGCGDFNDSPMLCSSGTETMDFGGPIAAAAIQPEKYEVAAGSNIKQRIHTDTNPLDHYEEIPAGMIYITYTDEKTVKQILAAGKRKESKEGFLTNVKVGNP